MDEVIGKRAVHKRLHEVLTSALVRSKTPGQKANAVSTALHDVMQDVLSLIGVALMKQLRKAFKAQFKGLRNRLGEGSASGLPKHLIFSILKDFGKVTFKQESCQQEQMRAAVNEMDGFRQQLGKLLEPETVGRGLMAD